MKRIARELWYDLREPGINIWMLPAISAAFVLLSWYTQRLLGDNNTVTPAMLETLIPFLGGYGSLMLMQGLLDTEGGEIQFSYPRSNLYWGLIRQFRFFLVYAALTAAVCGGVAAIMDASFGPLFLLTLFQSFALMAVAFLGISLSRSVSAGLITLLAFVGVQVTLGREFGVFNWLYLLDGRLPSADEISGICARSCVIGVFGWGVGQLQIRP